MAQTFRGNRRSGAMNASLSSAFDVGIQPEHNRNNDIVVKAPTRKSFTLVTKEGNTTDAGQYWYEELLPIPVPTLFQYEQPLIWDTHVKWFDGQYLKSQEMAFQNVSQKYLQPLQNTRSLPFSCLISNTI